MDALKRQLPPVPESQKIKEIKLIPGYTKLSELQEIDGDPYERLVYKDDVQDNSLRLKAIEEAQDKLTQEFRLGFQTLLAEIKKLQESIEDIKSLNIGLQKSLVESSTLTARNVKSLKSQFSETSEHLERCISGLCGYSGKRGSALDVPNRPDVKTRHSFDWDIQCVDSLVKSQGQVSSQSYLIGNINYKVLGGVNFSKDGCLSVYLYGESVRPQDAADEIMERGRFKCSVCITDRTGALMNWNVGRAAGNFFKSKNWMIGNVNYNELKKKGFLKHGNRIKLEFTIDLLNT